MMESTNETSWASADTPVHSNQRIIAPFSIDSTADTVNHDGPSVLSYSDSSVNKVPAPLVPSAGCGCFNLTQDSRGTYSLLLFLLCLGLLFYIVFFEQSGWIGFEVANSTCKQLRVVDTASVCAEPDVDPVGYNQYGGHALDTGLLSISLIVALGGNSVYHRLSIPFLLASTGLQGYVFSRYAVDAQYCGWNELSTGLHSCLNTNPEQSGTCAADAQEQCSSYMQTLHFKLVSMFNLSVFLLLCLLLVVQVVTMCKAAAMNRWVRSLTGDRLVCMSRWPAVMSTRRRNAVADWCEQHIFGRLFATKEQHQQLTDLNNYRNLLREVRLSFSLRVSLTCAFSLFVVSGFTIAAIVVSVSYLRHAEEKWAHELHGCGLAGVVTGCVFVWMMVFVHRMALRLAIKRRLVDYMEAERTTQSIESVLSSAKVRWFSLPFYFGSLFGSMLWSYLLVSAFTAGVLYLLVNSSLRPLVLRELIALCLVPAFIILLYRVISFAIVYGTCRWNHRVSLLEPPPRPRCYICLDCCGMWVGGFGGCMTVMLRLMGAFPTALSRLDVSTNRFDFVHDQYNSLVEVESHRVYRDWKLQQSGMDVDVKECELDEQLQNVVPV